MDQNVSLNTEIRAAIKTGNLAKVKELLEGKSERLHVMTPFGTWLHVAAAHGQLEIISFLIAQGIDINRNGGILEGSALNEASSKGHVDIVRLLLDSGAAMDTSASVLNPLFGAVYGRSLQVVKLLIDRGIDHSVKYTSKTMKNMDALAFARERGETEIAKYLATL